MKQYLLVMTMSVLVLTAMAAPSISCAMGRSQPISVTEKKAPTRASGEVMGRLIGATCNTRWGLGEITLAIYDQDAQTMTVQHFTVVDSSVCAQGAWSSPLAELALFSVLGTHDGIEETPELTQVRINSNGIVKSVRKVEAGSDPELMKVYRRVNLLDVQRYPSVDNRLVIIDFLSFDPQGEEKVKKVMALSEAN